MLIQMITKLCSLRQNHNALIKHTIMHMVIVFNPQVFVSVWCRCTSVKLPPRASEASWASFPVFTFVSESSSLRSWESLSCWER